MSNETEGLGRTILEVNGMACSSCVNTVTKALSRIPGVAKVDVNLDEKRAAVEGRARPEDLIAAIEKAGFEARVELRS